MDQCPFCYFMQVTWTWILTLVTGWTSTNRLSFPTMGLPHTAQMTLAMLASSWI
jgi:hypothetical protein